MICKFGEVGDGEYIDHRGRQVIIFDHIKQVRCSRGSRACANAALQQVTGTRPIQAGDVVTDVESLRCEPLVS